MRQVFGIMSQVASNGVVVTFLGGFEGSVGPRHLPSWDTLPESLPPRKKVKGRLLWVDVEGKKIGVSLQKTLVEGRSFSFQGVEFGDVFEGESETCAIFTFLLPHVEIAGYNWCGCWNS